MKWSSASVAVLVLLAACASEESASADPVVILDSASGCEGDGDVIRYRWERDGEWYVRGARRVPAGLVTRLRELALSASGADSPLPVELRITAEIVEERQDDIIEAACKWMEWLLETEPPEIEHSRVVEIAREWLIDPAEDTDWSTLSITLPGSPGITISSDSQAPYMQPWQVSVGGAEPRKVLSLDVSRFAMLLVDPEGPNYRYLEGAQYWASGFWHDEDVWGPAYGDEWNRRYARELCTELSGWEEVDRDWALRDAGLGNINRQPLSLQPDLTAKGDRLIGLVRWWSLIDDGAPVYDWSDYLDVHERATRAARRLPCISTWRGGAAGRAVSLDAVGLRGHNETSPEFFHEPVWSHSGLDGEPEYELDLVIDGEWVATLLLGWESDGALVLRGHESLPGTEGVSFHPTVGKYALLRPDGRVELRKMPPIRPR